MPVCCNAFLAACNFSKLTLGDRVITANDPLSVPPALRACAGPSSCCFQENCASLHAGSTISPASRHRGRFSTPLQYHNAYGFTLHNHHSDSSWKWILACNLNDMRPTHSARARHSQPQQQHVPDRDPLKTPQHQSVSARVSTAGYSAPPTTGFLIWHMLNASGSVSIGRHLAL